MSRTIETKRKRGRPRKIDNTLTPAAVEEIDEIEDLLQELPSNYRVTVDRVEPEWCAGYCGKFFVSTASRVSLEEIKRRFGGHVFRVKIYNESGQLSKQRMISIDEVPRREGKTINRDGTTDEPKPEPKEKTQQISDHVGDIMSSNLPAQLKRQMIAMFSGFPMYNPPAPAAPPEKDPKEQLQVYQMINDMMQSNRDSQAKMARANMELLEAVFDLKMKTAQASAPADPLNQLNQTIELVRAMNGVKSELQPATEESLASQLIGGSLPMVHDAISEYIRLKKATVQAELQKNIAMQSSRPPIEKRINSNPDASRVIGAGENIDPVTRAREMARLFKSLSPENQADAMGTFFSELEKDETALEHEQNKIENIAPVEKFDRMEEMEVLDSDDRATLNHARGGNGNTVKTGHVPHRERAGTAENDDPLNRPGNPERFSIPSD